jgi:hypothetical protein
MDYRSCCDIGRNPSFSSSESLIFYRLEKNSFVWLHPRLAPVNIRARHQSITSPGPQSKLSPKNLHPRALKALSHAEYWCLALIFEKDPLSRAKGISVLGKTEIIHIFDRESEERVHVQQFETTLRGMKEAQGIRKTIKYTLGYTYTRRMVVHIVERTLCRSKSTRLSLANPMVDLPQSR